VDALTVDPGGGLTTAEATARRASSHIRASAARIRT
jgi:hypothetical protein